MKCTLLNTGKTESGYLLESIKDYSKRINKFISFEIIDVQTNKISGNLPNNTIKEKEASILLKKLHKADMIILLDERGKQLSSREFATKLHNYIIRGIQHIIFVTGGAYGFADSIYQIANDKISLSRMTFTHQIVRLVFVEQLYRALTIINGLPYHHD